MSSEGGGFGDFMMSHGGAVVGAAASGLGAIGANRRARKAQKRAHQYNKDMFDYMNTYNTPVKQMERLKDAGLNPALMYGQGTTGNATQGVAPYQAEKVENIGAGVAQGLAAGTTFDLSKAQKDNIEANTLERIANAELQGFAKKEKELLLKDRLRNLSLTGDILEKDISLKSIEVQLKKYQIPLTEAQTLVARNTAEKIASDVKIQKRIEDEIDKGYGSGTLQTIGNFLGIENVESNTAKVIVGVALLSQSPLGKLGKLKKGGQALLKLLKRK